MSLLRSFLYFVALTSVVFGIALPSEATQDDKNNLKKIEHIIVIYLENWSFDALFSDFPGADGACSAKTLYPQVDTNGNPYIRHSAPL